MNITQFRNSYIIDKAYRLTLVSVTLTALAPLIEMPMKSPDGCATTMKR